MNWIWLLINLALAHSPNSDFSNLSTPDTLVETSANVEQIKSPQVGESAILRAQAHSWFTFNYSPIDFLVPGKFGVSVGYSNQPDRIYELEILSGRFTPFLVSDLGAFGDRRISLLYRSFGSRNSFNYQFGVSHLLTNLQFGNRLYNKVIGAYPYGEAFEIQSIGLQFGIGNEWIFSQKYLIPLRVDWISIIQPVYALKQDAHILDYLTDVPTRESINTALTIAKWTPRFVFFKIQAGFAI